MDNFSLYTGRRTKEKTINDLIVRLKVIHSVTRILEQFMAFAAPKKPLFLLKSGVCIRKWQFNYDSSWRHEQKRETQLLKTFQIFEFISCEIFVFQFSFFLSKLSRLLSTVFEVFSLMKTSLLMSQNQKNLKMNSKNYLDFYASSICYFVSLDDCGDLKIVMI